MPRYAVTCAFEKTTHQGSDWYANVVNTVTLGIYKAENPEMAKAYAIVRDTEIYKDHTFVRAVAVEIPEENNVST